MNANERPMNPGWLDADDAPDLSQPAWRQLIDATPVSRGRPRAVRPKLSTTIRLDADVVEHFRAGGPGWQSRINAVLRAGIGMRGG